MSLEDDVVTFITKNEWLIRRVQSEGPGLCSGERIAAYNENGGCNEDRD